MGTPTPTPSALDRLLDDAAELCTDAAAHLAAHEEMLAGARSRLIDVGHLVQDMFTALGDVDRAIKGCLEARAETAAMVGHPEHPERTASSGSIFGALRAVRDGLPRRMRAA